MITAMLYPEPTVASERGRGRKSSVTKGLSWERISLARTVLEFAPELADRGLEL
jgi:hypothetical protein